MNDVVAGRGEYATFRELKAIEDGMQKRMGVIELEQASQRAALMHLPEDVRKLTEAVQGLAAKLPQQTPQNNEITALALAMQRTLDVLSKQQPHSNMRDIIELMQNTRGGGGLKTGLAVGAMGVVIVLLGWLAFIN